MANCMIQNCIVHGHRIVDGGTERPWTWSYWKRISIVGNQAIRHQRNGIRGRITHNFRQNSNHVVVVRSGTQTAIPPGRKHRSVQSNKSWLVFLMQTIDHSCPYCIQTGDDQGIKDMVKRVSVRRPRYYRSCWTRLVVIVDDLWHPLHILLKGNISGLLHVVHEEISIVVVPHILLVKHWDILVALGFFRRKHVPIGHDLHTVRIDMNQKNDHLIQDAERLFIVL